MEDRDRWRERERERERRERERERNPCDHTVMKMMKMMNLYIIFLLIGTIYNCLKYWKIYNYVKIIHIR